MKRIKDILHDYRRANLESVKLRTQLAGVIEAEIRSRLLFQNTELQNELLRKQTLINRYQKGKK